MGNLRNNTASLEALIEQANALPIAKTIQETKTATPTKSVQEVRPDSGYNGLESVTIEAIPDAYQDVTGVTSTAATTLTGSKFVDKNGTLTVGTMPNNGDVSQTIDGLETQSVSIPEGYTTGGTIALDSTINDTADAQATTISEIAALLEGKSVGGGSGAVETCTVTLAFAYSSQKLYYTDSTGNVVETIHGTRETLTVAKNTIIFVPLRSAFENVAPTVTGGVTALVDSDGYYVAFIVTGDGTVTHNNSASGK